MLENEKRWKQDELPSENYAVVEIFKDRTKGLALLRHPETGKEYILDDEKAEKLLNGGTIWNFMILLSSSATIT